MRHEEFFELLEYRFAFLNEDLVFFKRAQPHMFLYKRQKKIKKIRMDASGKNIKPKKAQPESNIRGLTNAMRTSIVLHPAI